MKKFLQTLFSVKNENTHKVITILGLKMKFFQNRKDFNFEALEKEIKEIKDILLRLDIGILTNRQDISAIRKMWDLPIKEKPWRNLKLSLAEVASRQTAEFIIQNMSTVKMLPKRLDLHTYALNFVEKPGLYLEFGVYKGISINHIAKLRPNETIYGFDSFEGLPESWYGDYEKDRFKLTALPEVASNVELVVGYFENTLPGFVQKHGNFDIAYLNIDCDLYSSTKTIFNNLKGHISKGTVIFFDEYFNYPNWQQHEYKAFMEFLEETGLQFEYLGYVYDREKVAVRIL